MVGPRLRGPKDPLRIRRVEASEFLSALHASLVRKGEHDFLRGEFGEEKGNREDIVVAGSFELGLQKANPRSACLEAPERRDLGCAGGAKGIRLIGGAWVVRPDIGPADDDKPCLFECGQQFGPGSQCQMFGEIGE